MILEVGVSISYSILMMINDIELLERAKEITEADLISPPKRKKTIEYKETTVFDLFPNFIYTKIQKARIIIFHAYAANIRKIIRFASNFDSPNKVCLIYVVGEPIVKVIMNELEKNNCSSNVCVLTSKFPKEKIQWYKEYDSKRAMWITSGWYDVELNEFTEVFYNDYNRYKKWLKSHRNDKEMKSVFQDISNLVDQYDECLEWQHQYKRLIKASKNTYFKKFTCYRTDCLPKPFTHDKLDDLLIKIFPCGVEAENINEYSVCSPSGVSAAIKAYESGVANKKFNFSITNDTPAVRAIRKLLNKCIEDGKPIKITELRETMMSPPYGLSYNAYSIFCVLQALQCYSDRVILYYDGVSVFKVKDHLSIIAQTILSEDNRYNFRHLPYTCLFVENKYHKIIKTVAANVFDIKIKLPGAWMFTDIVHLLSDRRLPISYISQYLYFLIDCLFSWWCYNYVKVVAEIISDRTQELQEAYKKYKYLDDRIDPKRRNRFARDASWVWRYDTAKEWIEKLEKEEKLFLV